MSTKAKLNTQKSPKKAGCRYVQPISNDRADSFLGVQSEICPRASEVPCERDKRAHNLKCKGWTERRIAAKLGCSQPTVHRAIKRYRRWFGTTLPEDRGEELIGFARYRIAVEEHRIFLEHQKRLAMQEWRRSRKPVRKPGGKKGADQTNQPVPRRNANVSHFNAATRLSLQLTMLQAGYLGVHRLACDKALDIDERDRWDRAVKSRDQSIEELRREVAELKEQLAAKNSTLHAPREEVLTRSVRSTILESTPVENSPVLNQVPSPAPVATPTEPAVCDQPLDSSAAILQAPESMNQDQESTPHAPREDVISRSEMSTILEPPEEKRPRWDDAARQEALDYHCMIHGIPPLELHQVTGIPDPEKISPKMWMERYPYMIYSDRSIPSKRPPVRDTRKVITVW